MKTEWTESGLYRHCAQIDWAVKWQTSVNNLANTRIMVVTLFTLCNTVQDGPGALMVA